MKLLNFKNYNNIFNTIIIIMNTIKNSFKSSNDKYSFIKYLDMKKEKYVKYKNILQLKLNQSGGDNIIDIKNIQEALLAIKSKINAIDQGKKNTILEPYSKLKPLIDNINEKIKKIETDINGIAEISDLESKSLVNRINEINILIDKTALDYQGVTANSNVQFVKEKIDPEVYTGLISKYIFDTSKLVDDLKTKIGGGDNLVNNAEIKNNINAIDEKIKSYSDTMVYINGGTDEKNEKHEGILKQIKIYLAQMESLYLGELNAGELNAGELNLDPNSDDSNSDESKPDKFKFKLIDTTLLNYTDNKVHYFSDGSKYFLKNPNPKEDATSKEPAKDKVIVKPESSNQDNEFQYYDEAVNSEASKGDDDKLLETDFIKPTNNPTNLTGGAQITPQIFTTEIKKPEINKELVNLYNNWFQKVTQIRNEDLAIVDYIRTEAELTKKTIELDKLLFKSAVIKDLLPIEIKNKLPILERTNMIIKETISNCNTVISEFRKTKTINTLINCKNDDIFTQKYKSDLLSEIIVNISTKKKELESQLEKIISVLQNSKFIASFIEKKDGKQQILFNELESNRNELVKLLESFMSQVREKTPIKTIINKFDKIIKDKTYTTTDNEKLTYINALIKIKTNPFGNTEKELQSVLILMSKKLSYFDNFISDAKKLEDNIKRLEIELNNFPKLTDEQALTKINESKKDLEYQISIINDFINDYDSKSSSINKKYYNISSIKINNEPKIIALKGGAKVSDGMHFNDFILKLAEFEMKIREMKVKRNEVKKLIRKYNIRYTQFFNFQKYIVNYVSLVLAQKEYTYWQLMSKGSISFYENILSRLEIIIDKFEDSSLYKTKDTFMSAENIWFYSKHFFMIKILRKFLNELYKFWEINDTKFKLAQNYDKPNTDEYNRAKLIVDKKISEGKEGYTNLTPEKKNIKVTRIHNSIVSSKNPWNLINKIDTLANVESNSRNKNYFFLFNIFFRILDAYQMKMPPVANYMRINYNRDILRTPAIVFEKSSSNKHYMQEENILKCFNVNAGDKLYPEAQDKAKAIKNIYFEEVFDPDNFAENDALSMYMGLGNMLSEGKSIMLLTYGYSGVGKTFTLFGAKGIEGMLQSTLNSITDASKFEMKAFELYGLGVPYKFYWETNNFTHNLYKYELSNQETTHIKDFIKFTDDKRSYEDYKKADSKIGTEFTFNSLLDEKNHYQQISGFHISNFEEIVTNIDNIRRENGRIKSTINNPESSRSIMIYDFKITITIKGELQQPRLVVMDLPGKENLYQTYCANSFKNIYDPRERFVNHRMQPEPDNESSSIPSPIIRQSTNSPQIGGVSYNKPHYDEKMIKAMMYINPLWLGTIPETAEHFDFTQKNKASIISPTEGHLISDKNITVGLNTLTAYAFKDLKGTSEMPDIKDMPIHLTEYNNIKQIDPSVKNLITNSPTNGSHHSVYTEPDKQAAYGLTSRAIAQITNMIKENNGLEKLGSKINEMLILPDMRKKRYGYAGLEGIYINENILGLLQVLGEKIQLSRNKKKENIVDVVCSQNEVYKNILNGTDTGKTPIGWSILKEDGFIETDANGKETIKKGAPILVQDNEFISQIQLLRMIIKSQNVVGLDINNSYFTPRTDRYENYFRNHAELSIEKLDNNNDTRGLSTNLENIKENWINNYDYNKIFNIKNPPIKSILAPYLDDPKFQNFYLFFVTSNNLKEGEIVNLNTCDKQIQLMYDTRHFMEVISKSEPIGVSGQCKN